MAKKVEEGRKAVWVEARAVLELRPRSKWVNGWSPLTQKKKAEERSDAEGRKK